MVARAGAGYIEQMPLSVVDIRKIAFVRNRFDALLKRNHLVITGHHANGTELQPFRKVHRAYRKDSRRDFNMLIDELSHEEPGEEPLLSPKIRTPSQA